MYLTGFADEAAAGIDDQIKEHHVNTKHAHFASHVHSVWHKNVQDRIWDPTQTEKDHYHWHCASNMHILPSQLLWVSYSSARSLLCRLYGALVLSTFSFWHNSSPVVTNGLGYFDVAGNYHEYATGNNSWAGDTKWTLTVVRDGT